MLRWTAGGAAAAGLAAVNLLPAAGVESAPAPDEVTPVEDLTSEHGILRRLMLAYDEATRRHEQKLEFPVKPIADATKLIQDFIQGYHEKLEEDHVFPRFLKAGRQKELVQTLILQHMVGRKLTKKIQDLAAGAKPDPAAIVEAMGQFSRMYRPHAAWEDTVLFRGFRGLLSAKEYDELGDRFEEIEHKLIGEHGFEDVLKKAQAVEAALDIGDLAKYTPNEEVRGPRS